MMDAIEPCSVISLLPFIRAQILPAIEGWWLWGIIIIVLYFINVFISARVLRPAGLPESTKFRRMRLNILLSVILSWPLIYLVIAMLLHRDGEGANDIGLTGALAGWVFFIVFDFIANWKLFETYFPIRQRLGGSDAYAGLHRHVWGHLLTLVALVFTALAIALWWLISH